MTYGKHWRIGNFDEAETAINVLNRRVHSNKADIDLLIAKVDLLSTPFWHFRARRRTKRYIAALESKEE